MPSKHRDASPERRRERKERLRSDKEKSERRERHKQTTHRTSSTREKTSPRTSLPVVEECQRRSSLPSTVSDEEVRLQKEQRTSRPYPTFSKAHSKEAVGSHPSLNLFTPPPTDVDISKEKPSPFKTGKITSSPPSPPLTEKFAGQPHKANVKSPVVNLVSGEMNGQGEPREKEIFSSISSTKERSNSHLSSSVKTSLSQTNGTKVRTSTPTKRSEVSMKVPHRSIGQPMSQNTRTASPIASPTATEITADASSEATSVAPEQPVIQRPGSKIPPPTTREDVQSQVKGTSSPLHGQAAASEVGRQPQTFLSTTPSPALNGPPPPPPPPDIPIAIPRVDYLLQHGGLNQSVPRNLLFAGKPMAVQQAQMNPGQPPIVVANLFEPYKSLLGDYEKVIAKNGSLAVATGHKSVARRLLDRLENVFARDISSETCVCPLCVKETQLEDSRGVSWGEILELVSGRRELPHWPPFALIAAPNGLGISLDMQTPMQKVDIDVPEEYREHYLRQSRKTKQSVDKWLSRQGVDPSSPPDDVDDETLTFSILTHVPLDQRQAFKDLLGIVDRPLGQPRRAPSPDGSCGLQSAPTPAPRERPGHIVSASRAIQRLYRLSNSPRDAETAIYLLNNTALHNALATLAAVSDDEWDILISGRFDGFLRSGAEDMPDASGRYTPSRGLYRNGTPSYNNGHRRQGSYPSRHSTPAAVIPQYGAPIALDEDTEIAVLSEIERDIYKGMEALEDAFEALHQRAEVVRRALRERGAGLAAAAQRRKGNPSSDVEIRVDTPASLSSRWELETDDGLGDWDGVSEIAPDDSASNVSSARRRRPKRRNERRTPALIEEEDDDIDAESEGTQSPRKR